MSFGGDEGVDSLAVVCAFVCLCRDGKVCQYGGESNYDGGGEALLGCYGLHCCFLVRVVLSSLISLSVFRLARCRESFAIRPMRSNSSLYAWICQLISSSVISSFERSVGPFLSFENLFAMIWMIGFEGLPFTGLFMRKLNLPVPFAMLIPPWSSRLDYSAVPGPMPGGACSRCPVSSIATCLVSVRRPSLTIFIVPCK